MSGIRLGDIPDMDAITELGEELLSQSVYADCAMDRQKFRTLVAGMMGSKHTVVLLVVDDNDKPQGFLLGLIDDLFWSRKRYATDLAFYIRKGYRHLAPRVIKRFMAWAKKKPRVAHISMGIASGMGDLDRVGKMYESLNMSRVGGIYYKRAF